MISSSSTQLSVLVDGVLDLACARSPQKEQELVQLWFLMFDFYFALLQDDFVPTYDENQEIALGKSHEGPDGFWNCSLKLAGQPRMTYILHSKLTCFTPVGV